MEAGAARAQQGSEARAEDDGDSETAAMERWRRLLVEDAVLRGECESAWGSLSVAMPPSSGGEVRGQCDSSGRGVDVEDCHDTYSSYYASSSQSTRACSCTVARPRHRRKPPPRHGGMRRSTSLWDGALGGVQLSAQLYSCMLSAALRCQM